MGMELLEQLEQRIIEVLEQNTALRQELFRLQGEQGRTETALAEAESLREQLAQEQQKNKAALDRIENILERLKERSING